MENGFKTVDSMETNLRNLYWNRFPTWGIGCLCSLLMIVGYLFFIKASEDSELASIQYGVFLSCYVTICIGLVFLLYFGILPVIGKGFSYLKKDESKYAKGVFQTAVHIGFLYSCFWSMVLFTLAEQFSKLIGQGQEELTKEIYTKGAFLIPFLLLILVFGRILYYYGKKVLVLISVAVSFVAFLLLQILLKLLVSSALELLIASTLVSSVVCCILLGFFMVRQTKCRLDLVRCVVLPIAANCVVGLGMFGLSKALTPHVGEVVTILVCSVLGLFFTLFLLLVLRNFKESELEETLGGRVALVLGQIFHLL